MNLYKDPCLGLVALFSSTSTVLSSLLERSRPCWRLHSGCDQARDGRTIPFVCKQNRRAYQGIKDGCIWITYTETSKIAGAMHENSVVKDEIF
jgi:hypothetical protein